MGKALVEGDKTGLQERMANDIINPLNTKGENEMSGLLHLGIIDTDVLEKEFGKIQNEEIIITNERINHTKQRHPQDFGLFEKYGKGGLADLDMIIRDMKNSVMTFYRIRKRNLKKLIENNKLFYKKE